MKVLQINCVYNKGSTGKIMCDIHAFLQQQGHTSVICYGRGEKTNDSNVYKTCGELYSKINNFLARFTGIMYGGCYFSTHKLITVIKKEKPDLVHLHCMNGYFVNIYKLLHWLKNNHIRTVLTLHAEFMYTGGCNHSLDCNQWCTETGCGHSQKCPQLHSTVKSYFFDSSRIMWKKMKQAFAGFENLTVVSVSPWLAERAKRSPILANKNHTVILNGVDTTTFKVYDTNDLKTQLGLDGKKIVFHATPNFNNDPNHIKGGYYILKIAERMQSTNVHFVIAGNYPANLNVPPNVTLLGNISDQQRLAQLYSMADVTILASQKETFSMIVAESLCCGTPVVGFKAGAPEQITIPEYSEFVDYGDIVALQAALSRFLNTPFDKKAIENFANNKYSRDRMNTEYLNIYRTDV